MEISEFRTTEEVSRQKIPLTEQTTEVKLKTSQTWGTWFWCRFNIICGSTCFHQQLLLMMKFIFIRWVTWLSNLLNINSNSSRSSFNSEKLLRCWINWSSQYLFILIIIIYSWRQTVHGCNIFYTNKPEKSSSKCFNINVDIIPISTFIKVKIHNFI